MAGVCKDDDGKASEGRHESLPFDQVDRTFLGQGVAGGKVVDDQDD